LAWRKTGIASAIAPDTKSSDEANAINDASVNIVLRIDRLPFRHGVDRDATSQDNKRKAVERPGSRSRQPKKSACCLHATFEANGRRVAKSAFVTLHIHI
jgi:hypothetical protein